jgi:hypothetical protein
MPPYSTSKIWKKNSNGSNGGESPMAKMAFNVAWKLMKLKM